ncbi:MAG: site-2 protease family protein [Armatimonadetes bacterium CG_4_10_14_3_um_filter_66_18]|nr:site-2 protease family protein [Armatimonadota bacterium]OIO95218.1 MAG: hypothetical protein AUJ96_27225 [Armatimonadetes bacterium CG2_30_66_41]PIU89683.1 MAG: site-2 protease family protein [Armatimonadetes bacterium CG06_land_8_20_14_3_00_66_21]PIW17280.1 MAG: site-2 protease family protein [Armatimonadetes bacterium CG17_big_fil_post_rev_8_21_14_2_50_66_6]PIX49570.1 MAG: site-2 protease family protein [Armatimonadetes bacterium CG_4_8_14_3_um_filter_66_20]PIY53150.1 MAG: site-2 proteas
MPDLAERVLHLLLLVPVFIPAIVLHEYAHAWTAHRRGDMTAKMMGRLTLDPKAHFDPIGALMFVISSLSGIGFGWAKPVPVNFANLRNPLRDMVWVSAAGPLSNLCQATVWYALYWGVCFALGRPSGDFLSTPQSPVGVLYYLPAQGLILNLVLMAFNLLPIPPLDGSRILVGTLPPRQAAFIAGLEPIGFVLLLAFLYFGLFGFVTHPLLMVALRLLLLPFQVG